MTERGPVSSRPRQMRVDAQGRVQEEVFMIGPPGGRIYACLHAPLDPPVGGVLVCSSLHAELLALYRDEVLLARRLASLGVAVLRFHYRGAGHSEGETTETTFDSMYADASAAAAELLQRARPPAMGFVGARLGAMVAAAAASRHPGEPLLFWQPVVDPRRFFRDARRQARMHALREGHAAPGGELADAVRQAGWIDVLGYPISKALVESLIGRSLTSELGGSRREICLCQLGPRTRPSPEYEEAMAEWRTLGSDVQVQIVPCEEVSWFTPDARRKREDREGLIEVSSAWLAEKLRLRRAS